MEPLELRILRVVTDLEAVGAAERLERPLGDDVDFVGALMQELSDELDLNSRRQAEIVQAGSVLYKSRPLVIRDVSYFHVTVERALE